MPAGQAFAKYDGCMDPIVHAQFFATTHHVLKKGQMYGALPYTHHLQAVADVLKKFTPANTIYGSRTLRMDDTTMLVAAWLHDIVEDTDVKLRDVEETFGEDVAKLVGAVTAEDGANRKVRNALTYPKTRAAGVWAVRLKLADRIANVENGGASVEMYKREYPDFHHALRTELENDDMWLHLDHKLGFKR